MTKEMTTDCRGVVIPEKRTFFTADLHWGDERLHLFHRPFKSAADFVSKIIENWNNVVGPGDEVYVLGDVVVDLDWLEYLKLLNGTKHLVKGNYDTFGDDLYSEYFTRVGDEYFIDIENKEGDGLPRHVHLVHYPTKSTPDELNLVGHIHQAWCVQKNMINVGLDPWHFTPVSTEQINLCYKQICGFFDEDVWCANHPANVAHDDRGRRGTYWEKGFKGQLNEG
tara:strand:+ start:1211 stop:1882 length:672 start_codon:yes stop_codon:yes gene_type:complete